MKEKIRIFLVHLLFFIVSIFPFGAWLWFIIGSNTYCKIADCSWYNEWRILPFRILWVILLNLLFYFYYKEKYNKKRD